LCATPIALKIFSELSGEPSLGLLRGGPSTPDQEPTAMSLTVFIAIQDHDRLVIFNPIQGLI